MEPALLLAALFLPLFPLSMGFNLLFARVRRPWSRGLLLLAWPQAGIALAYASGAGLPPWVAGAALATAALYGLRALALRELGLWTGFMATSAWALLWLALGAGQPESLVRLYALAFSLPLVGLSQLGAGLERRFDGAWCGACGGLAEGLPRLAGVLVVVVLAAIATPLFPAFFAMLALVMSAPPGGGLGVLGVWLLWSWAGARLIQGLVVGPGREDPAVDDLGPAATWTYGALLLALAGAGVYLGGAIL